MRQGPTGLAGSALVALAAAAAPAYGQGAAPGAPLGTARTAIVDRVAVDSFLTLVPERQASAIERDAVATEAVEREAARRSAGLDARRAELSALLGEQVDQIDRVEDGIRIARELDADSRREALEKELRMREHLRDLVLERIDAVALERAALDREVQHARAERKELGLELDLLADRSNWRALQGEGVANSGAAERRAELASELHEKLRHYFEARRDTGREAERLAAAERAVDESRLRMLEIRRKLLSD